MYKWFSARWIISGKYRNETMQKSFYKNELFNAFWINDKHLMKNHDNFINIFMWFIVLFIFVWDLVKTKKKRFNINGFIYIGSDERWKDIITISIRLKKERVSHEIINNNSKVALSTKFLILSSLFHNDWLAELDILWLVSVKLCCVQLIYFFYMLLYVCGSPSIERCCLRLHLNYIGSIEID